jgi:hypothetical protein
MIFNAIWAHDFAWIPKTWRANDPAIQDAVQRAVSAVRAVRAVLTSHTSRSLLTLITRRPLRPLETSFSGWSLFARFTRRPPFARLTVLTSRPGFTVVASHGIASGHKAGDEQITPQVFRPAAHWETA